MSCVELVQPALTIHSHLKRYGQSPASNDKLAELFTGGRHNDYLVFRRFDRLSVRNLLCLQHKLVALETEIDRLDDRDNVKNEVKNERDERLHEVEVKLLELRPPMKEYCMMQCNFS